MEKTLYEIFKVFFKIGTLLLGGGYVILPIMQSELVEKRGWIDNDELCEYMALSQSLPGLIAANLSIFVGYKLRRTMGAITAIFGMVLPAFLFIVVLAKLLEELINLRFIQGIFWGVGIGVLVLIYLAIKEIWHKSVNGRFTFGVFLVVFLCSLCLKISPAILVILVILTGVIRQFILNRKKLEVKE